jgi:DNA-binding MarR family transcriptional regulator
MTKVQTITERYGIQPHYPDPFATLLKIFKTQTDTELMKRERKCLAALMYFAGYSDVCAGVTQDKIAAHMGCSKSTVYRALKGLEEKGFLTVDRKLFTANTYRFTFLGELGWAHQRLSV